MTKHNKDLRWCPEVQDVITTQQCLFCPRPFELRKDRRQSERRSSSPSLISGTVLDRRKEERRKNPLPSCPDFSSFTCKVKPKRLLDDFIDFTRKRILKYEKSLAISL